MKELMYYFWGTGDNIRTFQLFDVQHIVPIIIMFLLIILSFILPVHSNPFKKHKRKFELITASFILVQHIIKLIFFYFFTMDFTMMLPLYVCRISIVVLLLILFFNKKTLLFILCFWATVAPFMAVLLPDTSGFSFPHIVYFSFFIDHGLLFVLTLFIIRYEAYTLKSKHLLYIYGINTVYFMVAHLVNMLLGANYNYLAKAPNYFPQFIRNLEGTMVYIIGVNLSFQIICTLIYLVFYCVQKLASHIHNKKRSKRYISL